MQQIELCPEQRAVDGSYWNYKVDCKEVVLLILRQEKDYVDFASMIHLRGSYVENEKIELRANHGVWYFLSMIGRQATQPVLKIPLAAAEDKRQRN